ncbi:MAG: TIM44-like domain-containing protein [Chlorobaculum sp.]|nr:TIM44-like domain-containing protein [Chlorobaculum sp.]
MRTGIFTRLSGIFALAALEIPLFTGELLARAGGAGGGDGGSGYSGGGNGVDYGIDTYRGYAPSGHFNFSVIVIAIFLLAILYSIFSVVAKFRKGSNDNAFGEPMPDAAPDIRIDNDAGIPGAPPGFDRSAFLTKVRKAFNDVQMAWCEQNSDLMRRFISDGVYQRFSTQFKMMRLLRQTNLLSGINISMLWVDRIEQDGQYDIVHAGIKASMTDRFSCALNHELDEEGKSEFVEYWSFICKHGAAGRDMYDTEQCPNCGAPLPKDIGEVCQCKYCNATINSGEFDWVLAEITQQDDYRRDGNHAEKYAGLDAKVDEMEALYGDFCVQLVEDKASNAWMQMMTSKAMHDPAIMRRFVTDELFRQLAPQYEKNREIFNRLFLNRVTLINAEKKENKNRLTFAITCSYQRAELTGNSVRLLDQEIVEREEIMTLTRDASAGAGKGSIYQHNCSSCGAPVKDTLDIKCSFCGSTLNSTANDWIVSALLSRSAFMAS